MSDQRACPQSVASNEKCEEDYHGHSCSLNGLTKKEYRISGPFYCGFVPNLIGMGIHQKIGQLIIKMINQKTPS